MLDFRHLYKIWEPQMKESCYLFCFYSIFCFYSLKKKSWQVRLMDLILQARKQTQRKNQTNKKPNWPKLSWWANRGQFPLCGWRPSLTLSKPGGTSSDFNPDPFGSAVSLSGGVCPCTDTNQFTKPATLLCLPTKEPLPFLLALRTVLSCCLFLSVAWSLLLVYESLELSPSPWC